MSKPLINQLLIATLLVATTSSVYAIEYRSTAKHGVILYDAPVETSDKRFILSTNIPLEFLAEQGNWIRVRDRDGTLAWALKSDISTTRYVQVNRLAEVRKDANTSSTLLFKVDRNVVLELLQDTRTGWLKIKHRDGAVGYIRIEDVWGA
ncbi:SH3 domain-containing protein [Chitinibacter bivalviorum]|uniref:SH3 domain-containing protein n=1 Tax=Chitinibacter bivalviorum TaxID=2739434 RepID=A0A7H9BFU0_9NEIS|nr:SH3 domain-containing protein [Chitinibacter bivalviorum]QLG87457.1 SH3 domain-containing protein [Chitinibacter bivalviorum]